MVKYVALTEAKSEFSALVDRAIQGEEIVLTRHGKPVARIVKYQKPKLVFGLLEGKYPELADLDMDDTSHMDQAWATWRRNLEDLGK
jgi:prevent-host-death family protein